MTKRGSIYRQLNDKEWLHRKYWVEKRSMTEIAKMLVCSQSVVWDAFKRENIERRSLSEAKKGNLNGLGHHPSKKTRKKLSECRQGDKHPNYGKHRSKETRRKISKTKTKLTPVQRKLNSSMRHRMKEALLNGKNRKPWKILVDFTLSDLMQALEEDFRDGMTWENYGSFWHLDHIIPLAHFHYDSPEDLEFKKAWALGNLQPLLAIENLKKGTKFRFY